MRSSRTASVAGLGKATSFEAPASFVNHNLIGKTKGLCTVGPSWLLLLSPPARGTILPGLSADKTEVFGCAWSKHPDSLARYPWTKPIAKEIRHVSHITAMIKKPMRQPIRKCLNAQPPPVFL